MAAPPPGQAPQVPTELNGEPFDAAQISHGVVSQIYQNMLDNNVSEQQAQLYANMLHALTFEACNLVLQQQFIEVPQSQQQEQTDASQQKVPYTAALGQQVIELFTHGMHTTLAKCLEFQLPEELIFQPFLQTVAMHVFEQAKFVILSTIGQENTPEFQISQSQKLELVNQTAEEALHYYVNEYEKENGPIKATAAPAVPEPEVQEALAPEPSVPEVESELVVEEPSPQPEVVPEPVEEEPEVISAQEPAPGKTPVGNGNEKYGALGLLLMTLPPTQQQTLLSRFNERDQKMIRYYTDPDLVEQELDLAAVNQQLDRLKQLLFQSPSAKSTLKKNLSQLTAQYPEETLLKLFDTARPQIKQYMTNYYKTQSVGNMATGALPVKVQEALCQYLQKELS
ncbi:MAG: hypothetical protein KTR14_08370 [Vampirovibrio sp.]|nr:hypothetical protein [Vampirovibrio sp.]